MFLDHIYNTIWALFKSDAQFFFEQFDIVSQNKSVNHQKYKNFSLAYFELAWLFKSQESCHIILYFGASQ